MHNRWTSAVNRALTARPSPPRFHLLLNLGHPLHLNVELLIHVIEMGHHHVEDAVLVEWSSQSLRSLADWCACFPRLPIGPVGPRAPLGPRLPRSPFDPRGPRRDAIATLNPAANAVPVRQLVTAFGLRVPSRGEIAYAAAATHNP